MRGGHLCLSDEPIWEGRGGHQILLFCFPLHRTTRESFPWLHDLPKCQQKKRHSNCRRWEETATRKQMIEWDLKPRGGLRGTLFSYINVEPCWTRERGMEKVMALSGLRMPHYLWWCESHQSSLLWSSALDSGDGGDPLLGWGHSRSVLLIWLLRGACVTKGMHLSLPLR